MFVFFILINAVGYQHLEQGAKKQDPKNHMHKHQCIEHEGEEPAFIFKVVSQHRTALSRQVKEAVRIRRRGGAGSILNSRGEFNRCHIPRLVVEIEDQEKKEKRLLEEAEENEEIQSKMNDEDGSWMARKTRQLEIREKKRRLLSMVEEDYKQEGGKRKPKRLKYEVVKEGWGEEDPSLEDEEQGNPETPTPTAPPPPHPPPVIRRRGSKSKMIVPPANSTAITDYFLTTSRKRRMEDDLWVETEEDRVFLEEETLSFMMRSSNKRVAVREDAVVDCLDDKEQVPENKDDLERDSVSKDDRGSSWTDEESFERLVDECDGDSTP